MKHIKTNKFEFWTKRDTKDGCFNHWRSCTVNWLEDELLEYEPVKVRVEEVGK